ncbi:starch-binding protein [Anaeromicropila herbilytica]|uniref:Starch-binding module 26 domain-containing protein n=1 Tax=Anaeromicropila herbilytica TaxID=2785025 RepID=A0A7R7EQF8_9FIRM|nr:starch-binding protein [Anaeromicropila herbilytica]BCN32642.1 hypothetical protein bsdtb5_39370 [Anaeromicropila herbilytica]
MKKGLGRYVSYVLVLVCVVVGCLLPGDRIKAEDTKSETTTDASAGTKVYYYNANKWDKVCAWAWTMADQVNLATNAWPGDEMTDEGNGWYSYVVPGDKAFGILFGNGKDQTADCKDLQTGQTYWFTNGGEDVANDSGMGGGVTIVAATKAEAGWPEGPAAESKDTKSEDKDKGSTKDDKDSSTEKESDNTVLYVVIAAVVVVAVGATGVVIARKKKGNK